MGRLKLLPLLLTLAASSACSQSPVVPSGGSNASSAKQVETPVAGPGQPDVVPPAGAQPSAAEPVADGVKNAQADADKEKEEARLPKQELTPELLYEYLVSEIAGQRGMVSIAREGYLDLARKTKDPRIVRRAVEIAVFSRDQQAALELAKMWIALEPDSPRALQTVVVLMIAQGEVGAASPYLEKMLAAEEPASGFIHLPALFAKTRDNQAVLALVKKLSDKYPKLPEARYAYAQAAANADQTDAAVTALEQADALRPGWEPAALLRAEILTRKSRTDGLAFMDRFLQTYPAAQDVRLAYARVLVGANQYDEASKQFGRLASELPESGEVQLAAGLLAMQMDRLDDAETYLTKAADVDRDDGGAAQYYLARTAEARHDTKLAVSRYQAVPSGEYQIPARSRLAILLVHQGKVKEAREAIESIEPENDVQRVQLIQAEADVLREAKDYTGVYQLLDEALKAHPDHVDLLYDHAMAAEKVNKLDVLEADLRKVIKLKPGYAQAYNALGYTLAEKTNRLDEAGQLLDKALALAPEDAFILDSVGWLNYRKGNLDKAREYLERAWRIRQDPEIAAHLGEVLWVKGNRDEASRLWDTALQSHPENEALIEILKKFRK